MNANLAAILYLVSGVLFILALRGLSSPVTSQAGNRNGMIGMAIAVGVPLVQDANWVSKLFGFLALVLASVNIFGGFLVTQRMLAMYKKKDPAPKKAGGH